MGKHAYKRIPNRAYHWPRKAYPQCWVCKKHLGPWHRQFKTKDGKPLCYAHSIGMTGFNFRGLRSQRFFWNKPGKLAHETWAKMGVTHKPAKKKKKNRKQTRDSQYRNR